MTITLTIIYYILGLILATIILDKEISITYTSVQEYMITIVLALLWPVLVLVYLSSLFIHFLYILIHIKRSP